MDTSANTSSIERLRQEAEFYRLLRRIHMNQARGNYEDGTKLQMVMAEDGMPRTTQEFDERMVRAMKVINRD